MIRALQQQYNTCIYFSVALGNVVRPFKEDGTLLEDTKEFEEAKWGYNHPLMRASKRGLTDVLEHKLSK